MIADSVVYDPYVGRKIRRAGATVRIKEKEGMVNPRPVSYTHLDVYKRQDRLRAIRYEDIASANRLLYGTAALCLLVSLTLRAAIYLMIGVYI